MITLITDANRKEYADLLDQAYRLRHEVFVEEMGWEVLRRPDGRDIDKFDGPGKVEMIAEDCGMVVGYQRLLPTLRPYLLSEVYPQLCDGEIPRGQNLYEWTRFAVARSHRGDARSLGPVALDLVTAFVEWGMANDVGAMIVEMSPVQLLRFVQCHFKAFPLGVAQQIGKEEILAIRAEFDERTLDRLREFRGTRACVLAVDAGQEAARR
jgi:acyl-homoserine lactone synthase